MLCYESNVHSHFRLAHLLKKGNYKQAAWQTLLQWAIDILVQSVDTKFFGVVQDVDYKVTIHSSDKGIEQLSLA